MSKIEEFDPNKICKFCKGETLERKEMWIDSISGETHHKPVLICHACNGKQLYV